MDAGHLLALINDGISYATLKRQYQQLSSAQGNLQAVTGLSSRNARMIAAIEAVAFAASNLQPVLITGETGTGKGVLARAIHNISARKKGPFVRFQPSFGSSDLISSELFGHQKGSFTGATENRRGLLEEANNGTLFIDEVDELPLETQVILLNVLQEKTFRPLGLNREIATNFRLVAATNRGVDEILAQAKLRSDFYHRIAHFSIDIPPLRERTEDIPELAQGFLENIANRENLSVHSFSRETLARLTAYSWPGNVRELQAVVEGGVYRAAFHKRRFVDVADLHLTRKKSNAASGVTTFRERVKHFELQTVREALLKHNNNQSRAAASLQLDRTSLRRILGRE